MVEVLQFKAMVWPKVPSKSTYETQNFLEEHPPDPPSCFCIPYCKRLKGGRGLGTAQTLVFPRCALASAVFWLRHCRGVPLFVASGRPDTVVLSEYIIQLEKMEYNERSSSCVHTVKIKQVRCIAIQD